MYTWLDEIPLSRPKRNISRDFSDGVMVAEVVNHFVPRLVDLHNYTPANSSKQKQNNWDTLNRKVLARLGLTVPENVVKGIIDMKAGVIEVVLQNLHVKIEQFLLTDDAQSNPAPAAEEPKVSPIKARPAPAPAPVHHPAPAAATHVGPASKAAAVSGGAHSPPKQGAAAGKGAKAEPPKDLAQALLAKDQTLMDYQETVEILQVKVRKLEQLVLLKDKRIEELTKKLKQSGVKI